MGHVAGDCLRMQQSLEMPVGCLRMLDLQWQWWTRTHGQRNGSVDIWGSLCFETYAFP